METHPPLTFILSNNDETHVIAQKNRIVIDYRDTNFAFRVSQSTSDALKLAYAIIASAGPEANLDGAA